MSLHRRCRSIRTRVRGRTRLANQVREIYGCTEGGILPCAARALRPPGRRPPGSRTRSTLTRQSKRFGRPSTRSSVVARSRAPALAGRDVRARRSRCTISSRSPAKRGSLAELTRELLALAALTTVAFSCPPTTRRACRARHVAPGRTLDDLLERACATYRRRVLATTVPARRCAAARRRKLPLAALRELIARASYTCRTRCDTGSA